jgi:peptide/nickel transport system permease protein
VARVARDRLSERTVPPPPHGSGAVGGPASAEDRPASETGPAPIGSIEGSVAGRSPWRILWSRFRTDRVALTGALFIALLVIVALAAPVLSRVLTHHDPNRGFPHTMLDEYGLPRGPDSRFWFGADRAGRDLFVRTLYGARTSLLVAFVATGLSVTLGVALGLLAGYRGGWVDTAVSRTIDVVMSLPILLFAIGIAGACSVRACLHGLLQPGLGLVVAIIALANWTYVARIVRGQVLSLRHREFVEAARSLGASEPRVMFREILPNVAAPIVVYATLAVPGNILFEASLSYLGVGVPQTTPSWGRMLAEATADQTYQVAWWMMLFPGLFLLLTTLAFNLVGDGFSEALDPRSDR